MASACATLVWLVALAHSVAADVCRVCDCRYNTDPAQDFAGEIVDCSYRENSLLNDTLDLPITVFSLDLSSTNITTLRTSAYFKSSSLTELLLNDNQIRELANVFKLPELRSLDLNNNLLEYIDSDAFTSFRNLQFLNLANNRFTTYAAVKFHHLAYLEEIVLDDNDIGPSLRDRNLFDRKGFGLTNKLLRLSIGGINLNDVPVNFFVEAYQLRELTISRNNITEVFEIPFTLEYLDLSDNPIEVITMEDFSDLPGLRMLKLNNLRISEVPEYAFSPLHGLIYLELERNGNLTEFSKWAFGREVVDDADEFGLEFLSVKGSRLTRLDEDLLEPFSRLRELDLQGNPWRCDCNIVWLKQLQIPSDSYEYLRCFTPKPLYNAKIFELDDKYLTCATSRPKRRLGITLAISGLCLLLSVAAIWFFLFLPKQQSRSNFLTDLYAPSAHYTVLPMTVIR